MKVARHAILDPLEARHRLSTQEYVTVFCLCVVRRLRHLSELVLLHALLSQRAVLLCL